MAEIQLTFAWSESRIKTLRECAYRYYLQYFAAWQGWLTNASPEKQRAYLLKNLTNMPMFVGSCTHNALEKIIKEFRDTGKWIPKHEAVEMAVNMLRTGWKQSEQKKWKDNIKNNVNLEEHYYGNIPTKDQLLSYKNKVIKSVEAFYNCSLFGILNGLKNEDWLTIEDFAKFTLNTGEEVVVKIDTGFKHDGKVYLLDWKTGKPNNSIIEQLRVYAMYALKKKWTSKVEDILIVPVYLAAYEQTGEDAIPRLTVTMDQIQEQAATIRGEYPLLSQAHGNRDNPTYFKKTENKNACKKCFFREMCQNVETSQDNDDLPF